MRNSTTSVRSAFSIAFGASIFAGTVAIAPSAVFAQTTPVPPVVNNDSRNQPQGSGTCAGPADSANVRDGIDQRAQSVQKNKDVASAADCSTKWQQLNSTISPDQKNSLNAALKTGDSSAVSKVLTNLGVDAKSTNDLANYALTQVKTGDSKSSAKTGEVNAGNSADNYTSTALTRVNDPGLRTSLGLSVNLDVFGVVKACDSRLVFGNGASAGVVNDLRKHLLHDRQAWSRFYEPLRDEFVNGLVSLEKFNQRIERWKFANATNLEELRSQYGSDAVNAMLRLCVPGVPATPPVTPPGVPPVPGIPGVPVTPTPPVPGVPKPPLG